MSFKSEIVTLEDIATVTTDPGYVQTSRCFFNVPIYQRLYVWEKPQIEALLEDLYAAFDQRKGSFYLGGVLVVERNDSVFENYDGYRLFDLIDGQQRFTTLWLMSIIFREELNYFLQEINDKTPYHRIRFAIRPEVTNYFEKLISVGKDDDMHSYPSAPSEATRIEDALAVLQSFKKTMPEEKMKNFTSFVFKYVEVIFTIVPESTDLNKLFEVINNRGLQLQHHEILKARLLANLKSPTDQRRYGILWDACANMDEFVERNLKKASGIPVSKLFDNEASKSDNEKLASAKEVLSVFNDTATYFKPIPMRKILEENYGEAVNEEQADLKDFESDAVQSIISFPMLLLHTLRVWLIQKGREDIPRIQEKKLLQIFANSWIENKKEQTSVDNEVCSFIELLWEIRYLFDKYIIKWIEPGEDAFHGIRQLRKADTGYLQREKPENAHRGFVLLQSMLYHSQQITTHY